MTTPALYKRITPSRIPGLYFSWTCTVQRLVPWSDDDPPTVLRDAQGQPIERVPDANIYTALPVAVCPPSARDEERFQQRGLTLSATFYVRADPTTLILPDIRFQDRLVFQSGGSRYFEVLETTDVGEAGLLREIHVSERQPYPQD